MMYEIKDNLCVFHFEYNEQLTNKLYDLLNNCDVVIFSDYGTFECTMKNYYKTYYGCMGQRKFKKSIFPII